jgi:hypothetical protein
MLWFGISQWAFLDIPCTGRNNMVATGSTSKNGRLWRDANTRLSAGSDREFLANAASLIRD